jgi:subtilase family serine protease
MKITVKTGGLLLALGALITAGMAVDASAQVTRRLVTAPVDTRDVVALPSNVHHAANAANDLGKVDDAMPMKGMQMLLNRPPEMESAINKTIELMHDPKSPLFHDWMDPKAFEAAFKPAHEDVEAVEAWLKSEGFTVNTVVNGNIVDFTGTAGQVEHAFHTEIHNINVKGQIHTANMSVPTVPRALAPAVYGVLSFSSIMPHTNYKPRAGFTFTEDGETEEAVTPQDMFVIYDFTGAFNAGFAGKGQTIGIIQDSDLHSTTDVSTFRSTFGLTSFGGTLSTIHPAPKSGSNNCTDPGVVSGSELEAALDVEYSGAAAPAATIDLLSCEDTNTTFGGLIALENIISEGGTLPGTFSISFGECEEENGATSNAAFSSTYQEAVAAGSTVFVSSGDEGAASCDADESKATHGITASGFATTAFNVAVGGTDFGDTFAGTNANFWATTNSSTFESAKSYINEIPWNDSCASALIADLEGSASGAAFCNTRTGEEDFETTASGSGAPSGCFTGTASTSGEVSGSCKGNPKPSFQSVLGNPSDGVRDIPDVSLFAANGTFGHFYIFCDSDTSDGGATCTSGEPQDWSGAGGTSFSSPIWAGIQALVNEKMGGPQGNVNTVYYKLATTEYGTSGSSTCNSSNAASVGSSCIFYDVTQGDMDVNCTGKVNCFIPSRDRNGVLSTSSSSFSAAYGTTTGWDFATGIGTVNVTNLVNGF